MNDSFVTPSVINRFWSYVKRGKPDECWPWIGGITGRGYGGFRVNSKRSSKTFLSHRLSYEIANGPLNGLLVCHTCDNPRCCNPKHLFAASQKGNLADMRMKGRQRYTGPINPQRGIRHYGAKLTKAEAKTILERWNRGESMVALAIEFGVTSTQIWRIKNRDTWHFK